MCFRYVCTTLAHCIHPQWVYKVVCSAKLHDIVSVWILRVCFYFCKVSDTLTFVHFLCRDNMSLC